MSLDLFITLLLASIAISVSPGAGAVISMNYGLKYGLKRSYAVILGLQLGYLIQAFIVVMGFGALIAKSVMLFTLIKWIGVLYLVYLALNKIFEKVQPIEASQQLHEYNWKKSFITATLVNLTNIKATVFLVAFIPQFLTPQNPLFTQFIIISLTLCIVDIVVMTGYSSLASRLRFLVKDVKAIKIQNRITGAFLLLAALFVSTAKRT